MTGCPLLDSEYAARQNGKRLPCERLAEENAKLLMRLNAEHLVRQNVEGENAKLRELVDYMTPIALYAASERERDRMSELGVEV